MVFDPWSLILVNFLCFVWFRTWLSCCSRSSTWIRMALYRLTIIRRWSRGSRCFWSFWDNVFQMSTEWLWSLIAQTFSQRLISKNQISMMNDLMWFLIKYQKIDKLFVVQKTIKSRKHLLLYDKCQPIFKEGVKKAEKSTLYNYLHKYEEKLLKNKQNIWYKNDKKCTKNIQSCIIVIVV